MIITEQQFEVKGLRYRIRPAAVRDAEELSALRVQIDGETEYMDRERGEAFLDVPGFEQLIRTDAEKERNLCLVADTGEHIVGFSRCEGSALKRLSHKVDFGVCVLQEFWGYGIGKQLLVQSMAWADGSGILKMGLHVLETNHKAIALYTKLGFEIEGRLKKDKLLGDGRYYDTIVMGRFKEGIMHA
ncbi:GNAT family N-acetyltransferase [Paenibacillus mucilaginosus]|uniref:Acetyltransferase n=1 Tax=Paenibacillus mucilaginosus (strain KNP414) TaxID=1036673 RepID=F8FCS1_PAEMK|nr:GNAT family N-acetyltransferase [Paenibacillus mucilaginosus]AEI39643.1 acetyltransferase [Paenibacillus mucilaginosus KNP414]MCG7217738.1 GNAT family N-acetyltransferase [Paenibacillus mucilaginosus]WDM28955.1 GNAT family N-acetyltransferase [Paenibacillus mucilaginosus]